MCRHECIVCFKKFNRKSHLDYHIFNKVCVGKQYEIYANEDDQSKCKFCGKGFTLSTSMYRHMNHTCKIKKSDDLNRDRIYERLLELEEKSKDIDILKKENNILKKKVVSLEKNVNNINNVPKITNNTTNNNINNGIVAHINLIGYGKEDLSKIDKKDILKAIQCGYDAAIKLTETLHFNPKHPEYHNIYITNVKDKYAMMFDGQDWNLIMKNDLINKIYDDKKNYIEENLDDFIDSLSMSRKKALDRWLETDDTDERISKIKNEIKLLLYNKRNFIIDNHDIDVKINTKQSTIKKKEKRLSEPKR